MLIDPVRKDAIKRQIVHCLRNEKEIRKIVVFGSFPGSPDPRDLDVAVIQDSPEEYLPLALKYRRMTRPVAIQIPLDIFPVRADSSQSAFAAEIAQGEVIYEG